MWLIIVAIIIALLFIMFLSFVRVFFSFDESFNLVVRFMSFTIYKYNSVDNSQNSTDNHEKKQRNDFKGKIKKFANTSKTFDDLLVIIEILKKLLNRFKKILNHVFIKDFNFSIKVAGNDAADTAIKYGAVCSAIYPLSTLLNNCLNFRPDNISVYSDFAGEKTDFYLKGQISVKLIYLIAFAVSSVLDIIKTRIGVNSK